MESGSMKSRSMMADEAMQGEWGQRAISDGIAMSYRLAIERGPASGGIEGPEYDDAFRRSVLAARDRNRQVLRDLQAQASAADAAVMTPLARSLEALGRTLSGNMKTAEEDLVRRHNEDSPISDGDR
jgi:hypothetical protein